MFSQATQDKMRDRADALHASAKDGSIKAFGKVYALKFQREEGSYHVIDPDGDVLVRFNTRKLAECKRWLAEWLAN